MQCFSFSELGSQPADAQVLLMERSRGGYTATGSRRELSDSSSTELGAAFLGLCLRFIDERMHLICLIAAILAETCACAVYFIRVWVLKILILSQMKS